MTKVVSCGIAPVRKNGDKIEILLCVPIEESYSSMSGSFHGMGFLKGQIENDASELATAKREFAEESGDLQIELFDEDIFFTQNNPKKKIVIWPAKVLPTEFNYSKISDNGIVHDHDEENALIKFYPIDNLPPIFRNQQEILVDLLDFIKRYESEIL